MSVESARDLVRRPSLTAVAVIGLVFLAQVLLLALYLATIGSELSTIHLYPIVWITASAWVIWHARPPRASARRHLIAAGLGIGYFLVLAYVGGLFSIGAELTEVEASFASGLRIQAAAPPGYAPALLYVGRILSLALIPYLLVGYITLAYLVYVTILDAWTASAPGLIGLFGCIGCSWPILASLVAGGGATGSLASAVYANAYPLSTIAFLLAVGLLYWRPTFESIRRRWPA